MSAFIEQEAKQYGFVYIEMDGETLEDMADKAARSWGLKAG